jgi:EamA domain-containing membrane protein RarD
MTATTAATAMRDDRVFPATRLLGAVIVPFLLVAFALLYFFPDDTRHWFAWDVQPTITPLLMGAGYIAGAYFFVRVARETRWHRIHVGFLPVTAFTLFMAIGTFNHLDRFATEHVAFWIWVGLYVVTPVLVPLAQSCDRSHDAGTA